MRVFSLSLLTARKIGILVYLWRRFIGFPNSADTYFISYSLRLAGCPSLSDNKKVAVDIHHPDFFVILGEI